MNKRLLLFSLVCLWMPWTGFARVTLNLDRSEITLDETVNLMLRVEGGMNRQPPPLPLPDGLETRGTSIQNVNINGDRETIMVYELFARKPGEYELGPYTLNLPGGRKELPALKLTVTPAREVTADDEVFVTLESSESEALVRQPMQLTLTFYSQHRIGDIEIVRFSEDGLDIGEWREVHTSPRVINGKRYTLRRFINQLTPTQRGTHTLNPLFRVQVVRAGNVRNDPFGMMFSRRDLETLRLRPKKPLELTFTAPPEEGRPENYSGHIGSYRLSASVSPTSVRAGDPVTLRVELNGSGGMKDTLPPSLEDHPDFKIYDPQIQEEDLRDNGLSGRKVLEQVVIPRHGGVTEVPAVEFSYYDPELGEYQVLRQGPFPIEVAKGAGGAQSVSSLPATESAPPTRATLMGEDLLYLKTDPGSPRTLESMRPGWGLAGASALPFALWGLASLALTRRERRRRDPEALRRREAPRRLRKQLAALSEAGNDVADVYKTIWACLSDYLIGRLGLPPGDLDPNQVRERLPESMDPEIREELIRWMDRCERARFAGAEPGTDPSALRGEFQTFMPKLDREVAK